MICEAKVRQKDGTFIPCTRVAVFNMEFTVRAALLSGRTCRACAERLKELMQKGVLYDQKLAAGDYV